MNKSTSLLIAILILFTNCSDMLQPDYDNIYSRERLINDPAFAEGLLLRAYINLPNQSYSFDELATDDAISNVKGNDYSRMSSGQWSALYNPVSYWESSYQNIAYINEFLAVAPEVIWSWESERRDSLFYNRYRGEALALRAYYHFLALVAHGGLGQSGEPLGVPYISGVIDQSNIQDWDLERPAYRETVDSILSDLNRACGILPMTYSNIANDDDYNRVNGIKNTGRISGLIARALMARVALHAASPAYNGGTYNTELLSIAVDTAAFLINYVGGINAMSATGVLKDPYFFDFDNDRNNRDVLWRSNFFTSYAWEKDNLLPSKFGNGRVNPSQNFVNAFPAANGYPITQTESGYNSANPYSNRDPRLENIVYFNGSTYSNSDNTIINTADHPKDGIGMQTNSTLTGYYLRKPLRVDVNLNPSSLLGKQHIRPLIRYTEIFLIFAEAANELWGPDADPRAKGYTARKVISNIRLRAKITQPDNYLSTLTTQIQMKELIRNERRIELSFEGFRFWDLRRWGDAEALNIPVYGVKITRIADNEFTYEPVVVEERNYLPHMLYGPIPNDQLLKSKKLVQNKGW